VEKQSLTRFLQNSGLVSANNATIIAGHFAERAVLKNELLLREGKICNEYFFLEAGFMRSFAIDPEGNEITTNFYRPNEMIFEVSSFFTRTASKENVHALEDSTGYSITYEQLNSLFHGMEHFREFGRFILVKGFSTLKTRMLSMITETAEERYQRLLTSNPEIFQHAPLKMIASYLGITDTSLSRIRKDLSRR
jgi:CRP-like cAMP-binding protein